MNRLLLLVFCLIASASASGETILVGHSFDHDDNIAFMPTQVVLFSKRGGPKKYVTSDEWAELRQIIGKPGSGEWEHYESRQGPGQENNSFRFFGEDPGFDHFVDDIRKTLKMPVEKWQGPSWPMFVFAMSTPEMARETDVITARSLLGSTLRRGYEQYQKAGYFPHLPEERNLHGVGGTADPSERKTLKMKEKLDRYQNTPLLTTGPMVVDPSGKGRRQMHLWGFSDDDNGNFETAARVLGEEVAKGRWPDVKITLFYTRKGTPSRKDGAYVLTDKGVLRPKLPEEIGESKRVLWDLGCRTPLAKLSDHHGH